jgi:putative ABC transport system permease protein
VSALKRAWHRLLSLFNGHDLDRDFDEEARSHIDLAIDDYVEGGMPLSEARRLAHVSFGSVAASKDAHRDSRGLPSLEGFFFDLKHAWRGLRRDRGFTLSAVTTLALAIGLNVTVFTIMDAMLFRGFPLVQGNDRLVYLQERYPSGVCCISYADFADWRAQAQSFDGMSYIGSTSISIATPGGHSIDTTAFLVSTNTFALLGVPPMLGRDFAPADEAIGAAPVAIINHRFWGTRLGQRADIVNSTVHINGIPTTVIGVMPERFDFPTREDVWMPVVHTRELHQRGLTSRGFTAVARLRDGVRPEEARAEIEAINRRLESSYPATNRGLIPTLAAYEQLSSGPDARLIWGSLWAGAWFVLLIACANVANLSLVRTIGRWREFSTRVALGAGQARMLRQVVVESLTIATAGGGIAWWITTWSMHQWEVTTASRYQVLDYAVDSRTLVYLVAITAATAILCSLAPATRIVQLGVGGALRGDVRGVTHTLRTRRLAAGLVAGQMALAIVLLSGAGVLIRSFLKIVNAETGVRDPERVLAGSIRLPSEKYSTPSARTQYFDQLDEQLRTIPGIEATSVSSHLPVYGANSWTFEVEGRPSPPDGSEAVQFFTIGSGYFPVVGAPLIAGRDFNDHDRASTLRVAIVNESFAAKYWPGESPVGKRLRSTARSQPGDWRTVVGVAPNIMQGDALRQNFKPLVYVPFRQQPLRVAFFLARTNVPVDGVAQAVRARVDAVDSDVALEDLQTLEDSAAFDRDYMDPEHSELGKHAAVAPVFAVIALLLSALGLGAVVAHSVSQRTKEIGVRMAIGAASRDVRALVFREGMMPVLLGTIVGVVVALAVNRILRSQLVGVSPYDPLTMTSAPVILFVVALLACQIPARRAMRVDPVLALRQD